MRSITVAAIEEALAAYDQAIRINANVAKAHDGRGWVLWHLKRYEEALAAYNRVLELSPRYASAHHGKGNVLAELRRYQEAAMAYGEAVRSNPRLRYAYLGKGDGFLNCNGMRKRWPLIKRPSGSIRA